MGTCDEQEARKGRDSARDSARERSPAIRTIQPRTEPRGPVSPIALPSAALTLFGGLPLGSVELGRPPRIDS
eukprot:15485562-Alexandrium_andersonii.AAC.1